MLTFRGAVWFMNRTINNELNPIDSVVIGKGSKPVTKEDEALSNYAGTKPCKAKIDQKNNSIILTVELTDEEKGWIKEIGAVADGWLISRDLIEEVPEGVSKLDYVIEFDRTNVIDNWELYKDDIYYIHYGNSVKGVAEDGTGTSYHKSWGLTSMTKGSYFYDHQKQILYIKTLNGKSALGKKMQITNKY